MPELPEVEVVRRGLAPQLTGRRLTRAVVRAPRLRWPIPALDRLLAGREVRDVGRRGKYLLMGFDDGWLIVHLGMSGTLLFTATPAPAQRHDHLDLEFEHGTLRMRDPRRFGAVLWHDRRDGPIEGHVLLAGLGIEPFDERFDADFLYRATRHRRTAIKTLLLGGTVVVGVGNIYASESLHRAGIRPTRAANRIAIDRYRRLVTEIRATLVEAIDRGGSSLRDFVSSHGEAGGFQLECLVYDRAGEPCRGCASPVRVLRQQQRSTYYCAVCQR